MMIRTNYPYGTRVRLSNPRYKRKKFYFLRLENGQAVIFNWGQSEKSSFALFTNPLKVFRAKEKALSSEKLQALRLAVESIPQQKEEINNKPQLHKHTFDPEKQWMVEQVCTGCDKTFKQLNLKN